MKSITTFIIILVSITLTKGQWNQYCTGFETNSSNVQIDTTGIWRIGHPSKTIFNSNMEGFKSIMTDTLNSYPTNDTSSFTFTMQLLNNGLAEWNFIEIDLDHRFYTDTITDKCLIALSIDGGNEWFDMLSDTLSAQYNFHHFTNSSMDILGAVPSLSGNSHGWVYSQFQKDIWQDFTVYNIDSVIIKFSFISDSIQTNKDGWQIDNLCFYEVHVGEIKELSSIYNFACVYPIPAEQELTFKFDNSSHQPFELTINNIQGQNIIKKVNLSSGIIVLKDIELKPGIYFYELSTNETIKGVGKIIIKE